MTGELAPGTLGAGDVEAITAALGPGGAVTVLGRIFSWLRNVAPQRQQPVPFKITIEVPGGGKLEIDTGLVQALSPSELSDQLAKAAELLSPYLRSADQAR